MAGKAIRSKTGLRQFKKAVIEAKPPKIELAFLLQDWSDAYNVGGMYRVADGVGAKELFASGDTPLPPDPMVSVTSLGHHRRITTTHVKSHPDCAQAAIDAGYALVGVELSEGAVPYDEFDWPERVCLVLGNEERGVYGHVSAKCQASVFVPMYGKGRSLNVHVTAAVVGYHATVVGSPRT